MLPYLVVKQKKITEPHRRAQVVENMADPIRKSLPKRKSHVTRMLTSNFKSSTGQDR